MTDDADRRIIDLARAMGARMIVDDDTLRSQVPGATALDVYSALLLLREIVDARLRDLEPRARAERIEMLGGLN